MVRETRYLWVGNIPEKVTDEKIAEHFKRYGKIQSVKLRKDAEGNDGALVAFTDIKSASKAHGGDNILDGIILLTEYSEPSATGSAIVRPATDSSVFVSQQQPLQQPPPPQKVRPLQPPARYPAPGRNEGRDQPKSTISYPRYAGNEDQEGDLTERAKRPQSQVYTKKGQKWGPSPSQSRSRSSSTSSSHSSSSSSSGSRSRTQSRSSSNQRHTSMVQKVDSNEEEKGHLGIFIRNLPPRSSDSSLRDGLFHEYKKYGKVTAVSVQGDADNRFAIISFKKHDDASKALEMSQNKTFFGRRILTQIHEGIEPDDCEFRPPEAELDEYHPKATRTLFVGNLEKDISTADLRVIFKNYGDILDVDIKKQGAVSAYAFVQYTDITSVVRALRKMDGENIGANKIKLGFGKSMPTNCIWLDCIAESVAEKYLLRQFSRHGHASHCVMDRDLGRSLIFYDNVEFAQFAMSEMRGRILGGKRIQIDFASRDCQSDFYDKLESTGQLRPGDRLEDRTPVAPVATSPAPPTTPTPRFRETPSFEPRTYPPAYPERPERPERPAFRNSQNRVGRSQFRGTRGRNFYGSNSEPGYANEGGDYERRPPRRHFDEFSQGSNTSFINDDSYEQELRDYSYGQRERRDFDTSPSPHREPPRRVESRDCSPFRRLPAQYEQYDRYPDRYSDRYRDTDSQGELDSLRSEPRRDYRDRYSFEDKSERVKRHRRSESMDSQSGSSHRRSVSPSEKRKDNKPPRSRTLHEPSEEYTPSQRSHSPMDFDEAYREYRHKERRNKEREDCERTKFLAETRTKKIRDNSSSRKSANDSDSSHSDVSDSERKYSTEKGAVKRLRDDVIEDSEAASNWKLLQRQHSSRSVSSSGSRSKKELNVESMDYDSTERHVNKVELDLHERTRKTEEVRRLTEEDEALRNIPAEFSPTSDNSGQDTDEVEESQQSSVDLTNLQKEKLELLQMLKQLDDGGSGSDNEVSEDVRVSKRAKLVDDMMEDSRKFQRHGDDLKSDQSFRKQMEARRHQVEEEVRALKQKAKFAEKQVEIEDGETVSETEKDLSVDLFGRKKRKYGEISPDVKRKRSYRSKSTSDGIISMSDDEFSRNVEMELFKSPSVEERPGESRIEVTEDGNLRRPDGSCRSPARDRRHRDFGDDKHDILLPLPKFASSCNLSQKQQVPADKNSSIVSSPHVLVSPSTSVSDKTTVHQHKSPENFNQDYNNDDYIKTNSVETPKLPNKKPDSLSLSNIGFGSPLTDDSLSPKSPSEISLEERIRRLDEKLNKSDTSRTPVEPTPAPQTVGTTVAIDYQKYKIKKRQDPTNSVPPPPEKKAEPSDIVKSLLSRSSIFDEDSKRLERIHEKYEPKEYMNLENNRIGFHNVILDEENNEGSYSVVNHVDIEEPDFNIVPEIISDTKISPTSILKKSPLKDRISEGSVLPSFANKYLTTNLHSELPPKLTPSAVPSVTISTVDETVFVKPDSPPISLSKKTPVKATVDCRQNEDTFHHVKIEKDKDPVETFLTMPTLKEEIPVIRSLDPSLNDLPPSLKELPTISGNESKPSLPESFPLKDVKTKSKTIETKSFDMEKNEFVSFNCDEEKPGSFVETSEQPMVVEDCRANTETSSSFDNTNKSLDVLPDLPVKDECVMETPPHPPDIPVNKEPVKSDHTPEMASVECEEFKKVESKNLCEMVLAKSEEKVPLAETRPYEVKAQTSFPQSVVPQHTNSIVAKNDQPLPSPHVSGTVAGNKAVAAPAAQTVIPINTSNILGKRKYDESVPTKDCIKSKSARPNSNTSTLKNDRNVEKTSENDVKKSKLSSTGNLGQSSSGSVSKSASSSHHNSKDRKDSVSSKSSTTSSGSKSSHHKLHSKSPEKKGKSSTISLSSSSLSITNNSKRDNDKKEFERKKETNNSISSQDKKPDDRKKEESDKNKSDKPKLKDGKVDKVKDTKNDNSNKLNLNKETKKDSKSSDTKSEKKHDKVKAGRDIDKKDLRLKTADFKTKDEELKKEAGRDIDKKDFRFKAADSKTKDEELKKEPGRDIDKKDIRFKAADFKTKDEEQKKEKKNEVDAKSRLAESKPKDDEPKKMKRPENKMIEDTAAKSQSSDVKSKESGDHKKVTNRDNETKKHRSDEKRDSMKNERKESKNKVNEAKGKDEKKTEVKKTAKVDKNQDEQKIKSSKTKPDAHKESEIKKLSDESKDKKKKQEKNDKKGEKRAKDTKKDKKDKDHDDEGPDPSGKDRPNNDHEKDKENRDKDGDGKEDQSEGKEQNKEKSKDENNDDEMDQKDTKKRKKDDEKQKKSDEERKKAEEAATEEWMKNFLDQEPQFFSMYDKIKRRSSKEVTNRIPPIDDINHKYQKNRRTNKNNNNKKPKKTPRSSYRFCDTDDSDSDMKSDDSMDLSKATNKKKKPISRDSDESDLEILRAARKKKKQTQGKSSIISRDTDDSDLELLRMAGNKKKNSIKAISVLRDSDDSDLELLRAARNKKKNQKMLTITRDSDDSDLELFRNARNKKSSLAKTQQKKTLSCFSSSSSCDSSEEELMLPSKKKQLNKSKENKKPDNAIYSSSDSEIKSPINSTKDKYKTSKKSILAKLDKMQSSSDDDDDDLKLPLKISDIRPKIKKESREADDERLTKEKKSSERKILDFAKERIVKDEKLEKINKREHVKKEIPKVYHHSDDVHGKPDVKMVKKIKKDKLKTRDTRTETKMESNEVGSKMSHNSEKKRNESGSSDHQKHSVTFDHKDKRDDKMLEPPILEKEQKDLVKRKDIKKKRKDKHHLKVTDDKERTDNDKDIQKMPEIKAEIDCKSEHLEMSRSSTHTRIDHSVPSLSDLIGVDDLSPPELTKTEILGDKLEWITVTESNHKKINKSKKLHDASDRPEKPITDSKHKPITDSRHKPITDSKHKKVLNLKTIHSSSDLVAETSAKTNKISCSVGDTNLPISEKEETVVSDFNVPFSDLEASMAQTVVVEKVESVQVDSVIHSVEETVSCLVPEVDAAAQLERAVSELQKDVEKRYPPESEIIEDDAEYVAPDVCSEYVEETVFQQETDDAVAALMGIETTITDITPPLLQDAGSLYNTSIPLKAPETPDKIFEVTDEQPYLIEEEKVAPPSTPVIESETKQSKLGTEQPPFFLSNKDIDNKPIGGTVLNIPELPSQSPVKEPLSSAVHDERIHEVGDLDTSITDWSETETPPAKQSRRKTKAKSRTHSDNKRDNTRRSSSKEELFPDLIIESEAPVARTVSEKFPVATITSEIFPVATTTSEKFRVATISSEKLPVATNTSEKLPVSTNTSEKLPVATNTSEKLTVPTSTIEKLTVCTKTLEKIPVATSTLERTLISANTTEKVTRSANTREKLTIASSNVKKATVAKSTLETALTTNESSSDSTGKLDALDVPENTKCKIAVNTPVEVGHRDIINSELTSTPRAVLFPPKPPSLPNILDDPCDDLEPESPGALQIDMSAVEGDENEAEEAENDEPINKNFDSQMASPNAPTTRLRGKRLNRPNNQTKESRQRPVAVVAPNEIAPRNDPVVGEVCSNILQDGNVDKDQKLSDSSSESQFSDEKSPRFMNKDSPRSVSPRGGIYIDRDSPRRKSPGRQGNTTPPVSDIKSRLRPVSKRKRSRRCSFPEYDDREVVRDVLHIREKEDLDAISREKKLSEYDFRDDDEALEPTASFKEFESKIDRFDKIESISKLDPKDDFLHERDHDDMEKWTEVSLTESGIKLKRGRRTKLNVGQISENVPPISKVDIAADIAKIPPPDGGKERSTPFVKLEKLQIVEEKLKKDDSPKKDGEEANVLSEVGEKVEDKIEPLKLDMLVLTGQDTSASTNSQATAVPGKERKSRRSRRKKSLQGLSSNELGYKADSEHGHDLYEFRDDTELQAEVIEMAARAAIEAAEDQKQSSLPTVLPDQPTATKSTPDRELMPPPTSTATHTTMLKSPSANCATPPYSSSHYTPGLDQVLMEEAHSPGCNLSDGNHSQDEHVLNLVSRERHDSSSDQVEPQPVKEKRRRKKKKEKRDSEPLSTSFKEKMDEASKNEFLSNIDRIIQEVSKGNFDNKSIEDDPEAPPRRRGSRSSSKSHEAPTIDVKPPVSGTPTAVIQPLHQGPPLPPQNPLVALQQQGFQIPSMDAPQTNEKSDRKPETLRELCRPPYPNHPHIPSQIGDKSVVSPITPATPTSMHYQESLSRMQPMAVSSAGQPATAMKSPIEGQQHPPVAQPFPRPDELGKLPPGVAVSSHQMVQEMHGTRPHIMSGYPVGGDRCTIERQVQMERMNEERRMNESSILERERLTTQSGRYTPSQYNERVAHHGPERVFTFQHERQAGGQPHNERSPGHHSDRLIPQPDHQPSKSPSGKMSPRSLGVHVGVVQGQPYPIGQRETLQGQVIERVPNPNNGPSAEPGKLHSPKGGSQPMLSPDQLKRDQMHAQQMAYVKQNSELRAMLSQPSRLAHHQHQQMMPQQQLRPPSTDHHRRSPNAPQHRLPFGVPDRPPSHPDQKVALDPRLPHEAKMMNDVAVRHAGVSAFTSPDVRLSHPDHHPNLPPGHIFHPELGLQHPGMPYLAGVPRMIFPPGQPPPPEYLAAQQGHLMVATQQYLHPDNRLTPETRPPSRPLSAHGPPPGHPLQDLPNHPDSLLVLLQKYPVMWQGILALKNDSAAVQMHFVSGSSDLVKLSMPGTIDGLPAPLRIAQRMRLEPTQLDGVSKRMQNKEDYCMLLALPCGRDHIDVMHQTRALTIGFIDYLRQKQAAGIVNVPGPGSNQTAYVVHIFPPCEFSRANLAQLAPDLLQSVAGVTEVAHLLIVIATV